MRRRNNKLWMDILRVAMWYAPANTKSILKQINANDAEISKILGKLAQ